MKIASIILVAVCLCLTLPAHGGAGMASANYRITTSVMSGGGGVMASAHYRLDGTLGQPSPLIDDPLSPPISSNYELLTGFWYTIASEPPLTLCPADFQPDGWVDEDDLVIMAAAFGQVGVSQDVDVDFDMDGRDLWEMAVDFNRSDCFP